MRTWTGIYIVHCAYAPVTSLHSYACRGNKMEKDKCGTVFSMDRFSGRRIVLRSSLTTWNKRNIYLRAGTAATYAFLCRGICGNIDLFTELSCCKSLEYK